MKESTLIALASYCNNPQCKWASLDEEANKEAKKLFLDWSLKNAWAKPWDGFLDIVKTSFPSAKSVSRISSGSSVQAKFTYYGDTWVIE